MTAIPCGQKKRRREMIQSQMVTPPLAAIEGTTLRLKTATTNRRTRARRPRARIKWGWATGWAVVDKVALRRASLRIGGQPLRLRSGQAEAAVSTSFGVVHAGRTG